MLQCSTVIAPISVTSFLILFQVVMEKLIAEGGSIENFNDFWKIIMADGTNCVKCPEWCYIDDGSKGYQSCKENSECDAFKANQCLSHCAMI